MKKLFPVLVLITVSCVSNRSMEFRHLQLWYRQPANTWIEALPLGNGRMGAMVFGGTEKERIQLNEDSIWPGGPDWGDAKGTPADLENVRNLLRNGRYHEADKRVVEAFSHGSIVRSHQTLGDLWLNFAAAEISGYTRRLSLDSALVTVTCTRNGYAFSERIFVSHPDQAIVIELTTADPRGLACSIGLSRPQDHGHVTATVTAADDNTLVMSGMATQYGGRRNSRPLSIEGGVRFEARLQAVTEGGQCTAADTALSLSGARRAVLYLTAATSFYEKDISETASDQLQRASSTSFTRLLTRHIRDHQRLFRRVDLDLGNAPSPAMPTDERLAAVKAGAVDPALEALLFQYGRYLLISSSRPGTNPANLQGLWNEHIEAPWNADYHLNINLEMNYWPAEVTNLSECHEPLFDYIERLAERGRITARKQYGCRGFVVHHATDLWAPAWMRAAQAYWGSWIHGGGWLMQHLWEHYRFTEDKEFLTNRAWPLLRDCSRFYADWLVRDERDGTLISSFATSPENSYLAPDGTPAALTRGSAIDQQIIREVFDNTLNAAAILGIDDELTREIGEKRDQLRSGTVIGPDGRLLEWDRPYEEAEKGHRHMSHLYAFHPGDDITPEKTPALFAAVRKTLEYRLAHGGAGTGWSRGWLINFAARLRDGDMAHEHIMKLFEKSIFSNLFDAHPPFQIDGNFGYTAGVAEMLLQSHAGMVHLLPALPPAWPRGHVSGLKARGNITVNIVWRDGLLRRAKLVSLSGRPAPIRYRDQEFTADFSSKDTWILQRKGDRYELH